MHRMVDSMQTEILKLRLQIAVILDSCNHESLCYHDREDFRDAAMELRSLSQLIEKNSKQCSEAFDKMVP